MHIILGLSSSRTSILLIATISRQWKMHLIPGHRVELDPGITLRAKYGIKMKLERRN
jgi:hypothetical protein